METEVTMKLLLISDSIQFDPDEALPDKDTFSNKDYIDAAHSLHDLLNQYPNIDPVELFNGADFPCPKEYKDSRFIFYSLQPNHTTCAVVEPNTTQPNQRWRIFLTDSRIREDYS